MPDFRFSSLSLIVIVMMTAAVFLVACSGEPEQPEPEELTLSVLMAQRTAQMAQIRNLVVSGDEVVVEHPVLFEEGVPSDERYLQEDFISAQQAFEEEYAAFIRKMNDVRVDAEKFNAVVSSCIDCHERYCPGPIRVINNLVIR